MVNDSSQAAARHLTDQGRRMLALNFGNGAEPGGGFLQGHRGQESLLCRSNALYATLQGDAMYQAHLARPLPDATDWAILSPEVPIFRADDGSPLDSPWPLSFITCAAPYAPRLGLEPSAHLMASRIRRVLAIARAFGYEALVLGAWGCGTYGNDPAWPYSWKQFPSSCAVTPSPENLAAVGRNSCPVYPMPPSVTTRNWPGSGS